MANYYFDTKKFVISLFTTYLWIALPAAMVIGVCFDGFSTFKIQSLLFYVGLFVFIALVQMIFHYRNTSEPIIILDNNGISISSRLRKGRKTYRYGDIYSYYIQGGKLVIKAKGEKQYCVFDVKFLTPNLEDLQKELETMIKQKDGTH